MLCAFSAYLRRGGTIWPHLPRNLKLTQKSCFAQGHTGTWGQKSPGLPLANILILILLQESGILFTEPKIELGGHPHSHRQLAKDFITGKQKASSTDSGRGGRVPSFNCSKEVFLFSFFFFLAFCLFRAIPAAYGGSQARGPTGAVAAGQSHSHSNAGSEPSLRPTPQLTAILDP